MKSLTSAALKFEISFLVLVSQQVQNQIKIINMLSKANINQDIVGFMPVGFISKLLYQSKHQQIYSKDFASHFVF